LIRIRAVHKQSPSHRFPTLLWDNLPHGGASQVHPHIHATVHSNHYYGEIKKKLLFIFFFLFVSFKGHFESIRFAAERYFRDYENDENHRQKNYFRAIQDIHIAFNLTVSLNGISVLVPIVSDQLLLIYVDDLLKYLVHYLNVVLNDNDLLLKIQ
jgi:hypothetical protein